MSTAAAKEFPLYAADQCVKCGMCLPHCPTYQVTRDEGDSPRGRIMLMQGLATGMLTANDRLDTHLDGCLSCRACEAVCPADVPYGRLIDSVREVLVNTKPQRAWVARLMAAVLVRKPLRFVLALALLAYQRLGMQWLLRKSRLLGRGRLARLESLLPTIHLPVLPKPNPSPYKVPDRISGCDRDPLPQGEGEKNSVALFANCTSPLVEPETLQASVRLLEALGCRVTVPRAQTCCGALHQHAGLAADARGCAAKNLQAFDGAQSIVGVASGCTAQLVEYGELLSGPAAGVIEKELLSPALALGAAGASFARKSFDLHRYLLDHPASNRLRFKPLNARVLLHTPCTLRNVLRGDAAVHQLLARIPGLQVQSLDTGCCGAAGSYFLTQPEMADKLLEPKLEMIRREPPDYVLSSNVGCSMHLAAGLLRAGLRSPVWHPARLLAQQLDD